MSVEELLAAASVLAMAVDSDGEDGMELEDAWEMTSMPPSVPVKPAPTYHK